MEDRHGPWGGPAQAQPPRTHRRLVWLAAVVALSAVIWGLSRLAPGRLSGNDWFAVWRGFLLLCVVSGGLVYATGRQLRRGARHAAIWVGVVAVLALGYTFRGDLLETALRVRGELLPAYAQAAGPHTLVVGQGEGGHYYIMGAVNGAPVRFLIDTGASDIVLDPADAARAGIDVASLDYGRLYGTANGTGHGATIAVEHLTVGPIAFAEVPVSINRAPMGASLLGMTFLQRLDAFEVRGGRMFLRWKG